MDTIQVNINDAKTNFSKYKNMVKKGKTIILAERNIPFAQITPLTLQEENITQKRKSILGMFKNQITIHESFYDPMSKEEIKEWYGE